MTNSAKIMIGVSTFPGHAYCRPEFVKNLENMRESYLKSLPRFSGSANNPINRESLCDIIYCWNGKKKHWGLDGHNVIEYKQSQGEKGIEVLRNKQNVLRQVFIDGDYTHFFSIESDVIPPVDAIQRLVSHDEDIVSGLYFIQTQEYRKMDLATMASLAHKDLQARALHQALNKGALETILIRQKLIPTVWVIDGARSKLAEINDMLPQNGLKRVYSAGMGCLMIKREVLKEIEFKISYEKAQNQFTDFCFHAEAYDLGYQSFVDTDIWCKHLHKEFGDDRVFRTWFNVDTYEELINDRQNA